MASQRKTSWCCWKRLFTNSALLRVEQNGTVLADIPLQPGQSRSSDDAGRVAPTQDMGYSDDMRYYSTIWKADYGNFKEDDVLKATIILEDSSGFRYTQMLLHKQVSENGSITDLNDEHSEFLVS